MDTTTRRGCVRTTASALALAVGLAAAAAASAVHAQDESTTKQTAGAPSEATPKTPDSNAAATSGEVVVTARRQRETVRDVPSTIDVVTAGQLAAQGPVSGTGDLLRTVPGVRFNDFSAPNLSEITIRGSGTQRATGADSSVGLFFNGAYVGSSVLGGRNFRNVDQFDAERVEVLKGPQGALYGRNSEFGAVNIIPAKPEFKSSGYVDETYIGGLDQNRITGVVNMPVTDNLAIRVGAESYLQDGGFFKNTDTGNYYDHTQGYIIRGQARYKHGPLDIDLLVDAQDLQLPVFINSYMLAPGKLATLPLGINQDKFNIGSNTVYSTNQMVKRAMLTADYDLGWVKLTSTTLSSSFQSNQNYGSPFDVALESQLQAMREIGAYPLAQTSTRSKDSELYEDFHGAGSVLAGRISWVLGAEAYYSRTTNGLTNVTSPCTLTATSGICGGRPGAQTCYLLLPTSTTCPATFPAAFGTVQVTPQRYLSVAGYGLTTFDIGYGFKLTGQLRYTTDDKHVRQSSFRLYTLTPVAPASSTAFTSDRTNYDVDLSYKVPPAFMPSGWDALLYAKTGTGYRAGGVSPGISSPLAPIPFQPTYNDEDTTSYEAGLKADITRHIYFTIDGYLSRTTNAIAAINDGCTVLNACMQAATVFNINAGTEAAHGVEASVQANYPLFGGRFNLTLTGSDQRATYVAVRGASAGLPIVGSSVAQQPDYTASGVLDYTHSLTADLDGFVNITWNGQWGGAQDLTSLAAPRIDLINFNVVSLRTGVSWGRHVQIAFFVQNLTNQVFPTLQFQGVTAATATTPAVGYALANRYSQPRTYGGTVVYRW